MAFFKLDKPKRFTFIPRFYDERKEELSERIESIKKEMEPANDESYSINIKGRMRARHEHLYGKGESKGSKSVLRRLMIVVYVGLVLLIIYLLLQFLANLK
ncbi:MAG: hypothetical protein M0P69_12085 [Bacteroidales bacterium]|jgi:hypothetical protein|nr:hypothetical protein [Bacteroidales bacterium]MDD2571002.1 hypothetical protein [Bacteroidales bacterium]MDD2813530.1 hypothetical protein [Bacteroidales bacterium]MDD3384514.1 hypothetical protein [Bacteroidales bacterium]MDD3811636.1 hypothetical protein [Bacteroidales bacterium]